MFDEGNVISGGKKNPQKLLTRYGRLKKDDAGWGTRADEDNAGQFQDAKPHSISESAV